MAQKLYRYLFRGIGIVVLVGLIVNLYLAISSHRHHNEQTPTTSEQHVPGGQQ